MATDMRAPSADDIALFVRFARRDYKGAARQLSARQLSSDAFIDLAVAHSLSVVVLRALEGSPLCEAFSPQRIEVLESRRREWTERSLQFLAELESLADRFAAAGQRFMLLKGPYLASRLYGAWDAREFVDLDLLVPAADRESAFRLLAAAGYSPKSRVILGSRLTCYFVHAFDFTGARAKVDLHWCLSRHPSLRIDEEAIWAARRSHAVRGRPYDVLSDEHEVVFAILSILRDMERGNAKVKNVVDLVCLLSAIDAWFDWDAFFAARRDDGTLGPAANILGLCIDVADAHDAVQRLHGTLARYADNRVAVPLARSPLLFEPALGGLGNKLWCARVYEGSPLIWLAWWAASLPFRMGVHRKRSRTPSKGACPTATTLNGHSGGRSGDLVEGLGRSHRGFVGMRYGFAELEERYARLAEVGRAVDWKGRSFEQFDLRPFLEEVLPTLEFSAPRPLAMEYGTGTGPGACFLAERGFRVEAIDISPTAIRLARRFAAERRLEVSFEVADVCDLPRRDRRYDLVVDNYCLQRIASSGRRAQALLTVRRVLAVGGYFLIGTVLAREGRDYGGDHFDPRTGIRYRRLGDDAEKYEDRVRIDDAWYVPIRRYLRAEELRSELEGTGFEVVRQRGGRALCAARRRAA